MIPETVVKLAPEFVVWNSPLSVDTQTSPETFGLTTTFTGEVEEPKFPVVAVKVPPPSVEMKNYDSAAA